MFGYLIAFGFGFGVAFVMAAIIEVEFDCKAAYEKGKAAGKVEGKEETLSVLCDTDENAAIIEALGQGVLARRHGIAYNGELVDKWVWGDAVLKRANLIARGDTPRDAYKSYLAQREAANAICEQLDELERSGEKAADA